MQQYFNGNDIYKRLYRCVVHESDRLKQGKEQTVSLRKDMISVSALLSREKNRLTSYANELMDSSEHSQSMDKAQQGSLQNYKASKKAFTFIVNGKYSGQCNDNHRTVSKNVQTMLVEKLKGMIQSLEKEHETLHAEYTKKARDYILDRSRALSCLLYTSPRPRDS